MEIREIRGHITYLILAIEKITAERNSYVNELSYVSPDSQIENFIFPICIFLFHTFFGRLARDKEKKIK